VVPSLEEASFGYNFQPKKLLVYQMYEQTGSGMKLSFVDKSEFSRILLPPLEVWVSNPGRTGEQYSLHHNSTIGCSL